MGKQLNYSSSNNLFKILIISPFREFIVPLIAFGMVKNIIAPMKSDSLNDDDYYEHLSTFPKDTVIQYTIKGRAKKGLLLGTTILENGQKGVIIIISRDGVKKTIFKDFSKISIAEDQEDVVLKEKYAHKGRKVNYGEEFLSSFLDKQNISSLINMTKSELILIGNKKQLQDEIQTQHFLSLNDEKYIEGALNAMLRVKGLYGIDNTHLSELYSSTADKIVTESAESTILFDGANAFIRHAEQFIDNNNILLISKNDPSLEGGIIKFKDLLHYCGEVEKENDQFDITQFSEGTEIYSAQMT